MYFIVFFFFYKQKTAYEMRISDWSSDVCSSDLDSILEMNDGPRIRGMTASIPYLLDRYGIAPEVTIQTHADYYTIYDAKGVPFSRVMFSGGVFGMRELMSGKSEKFKALAPALKAARAGLTD